MHGDQCADLERVGVVEAEVGDELWILTHPDIRRSGRIYALMTLTDNKHPLTFCNRLHTLLQTIAME